MSVLADANADTNGVPSSDVESITPSPQAQVLNGCADDDINTIHQSVLANPPDDSAAASSPKPPTSPFGNAPGAATSRWRTSAHRVIQMNRSTSHFLNRNTAQEPGAEPGADPRRPSANEAWSHIHEDCSIQITDYSEKEVKFRKADNQGLIRFLNSAVGARPKWSKVRWINVGGISWDVISALALKHDLHPLAVEDVLLARRTSLSKADYYAAHLFVSTLCHSVKNPHETGSFDLGGHSTDAPNTFSPVPTISAGDRDRLPQPATASELEKASSEERSRWIPRRFSRSRQPNEERKTEETDSDKYADDGVSWILDSVSETGEEEKRQVIGAEQDNYLHNEAIKRAVKTAKAEFVNDLKGENRVMLEVRNVYMFLLRDGTFISLYKKSSDGKVLATPIFERLRNQSTLLRKSNDPSLLLHAMLDLIVDKALEIVDRYQDQILELEQSVLLQPKMKTVRALHILGGDLTLHKRTLTPIKSLVYGMRRYDEDRSKALLGSTDSHADVNTVRGYMSNQARVYLADVFDHMEFILSSMDMFGSTTENLISFTFNNIAYQTNETMRRLTTTTVIFFPLTFLTGYFGMNFVDFTGAHNHSDSYFWAIAVPVMTVFILLCTYDDVMRLIHRIKKRGMEQKYLMAHRLRMSAAIMKRPQRPKK